MTDQVKKVMAFGTFDIFHKGHESLLKQARKYGNYLIVVVARDKTVLKVKGKGVKNKEQKRLMVLQNSGLVNKAILGNLKDRYAVVQKYKPDVICLGYDQEVSIGGLTKRLAEFKLDAQIVRLKSYHPEKYKSSKLKRT